MDSGVVNSIDAFSEVKSADLIGVSYGPVTIPSFFLSFLFFLSFSCYHTAVLPPVYALFEELSPTKQA